MIANTPYVKDWKFVPCDKVYDTHIAKITRTQVNNIIRKYFCRESMVVGIMHDHELPKQKIETLVYQFE